MCDWFRAGRRVPLASPPRKRPAGVQPEPPLRGFGPAGSWPGEPRAMVRHGALPEGGGELPGRWGPALGQPLSSVQRVSVCVCDKVVSACVSSFVRDVMCISVVCLKCGGELCLV